MVNYPGCIYSPFPGGLYNTPPVTGLSILVILGLHQPELVEGFVKITDIALLYFVCVI